MGPPLAITLPGSTITVSRIGLGCAGLMRLPSRRGRHRLLSEALSVGINHLDVARSYGLGAAEGEIGRFAKLRRDELTIATKFGIDLRAGIIIGSPWLQRPGRVALNRVPRLRRAARSRSAGLSTRRYDVAAACRSFELSLSSLKLDYVDLLLLHDPRPDDVIPAAELASFLNDLCTQGKIRGWGISVEQPSAGLVRELGGNLIVQARYDLADHTASASDIAFGVVGAPLEWIRSALSRDPSLHRKWTHTLGTDPLAGKTLGTLLLAEALDTNRSSAVLYGTSRPERLAEAAQVLATGVPVEVIGRFRVLARQVRPGRDR